MSKDESNPGDGTEPPTETPLTRSVRPTQTRPHQSLSRVQFSQPPPPQRPSHTTSARHVTPRRASSGAPEKRMRVDVGTPFMERNLMTVERAMADFLLTQDDLDGLKRTPRRSPYPNSPELLVLSRKDVVQRANLRWGSPEKLVEELQRRIRHASRTASSLGIRRLPRDERRRRGEDAEPRAAGLCAASGRVVLAAIVMYALL